MTCRECIYFHEENKICTALEYEGSPPMVVSGEGSCEMFLEEWRENDRQRVNGENMAKERE